jgi:hypothetical protein
MTPPMHRWRHLGRRVPPMMRRRAAVAMMVVTVVVWGGGCMEEPPIIVGDIPHVRCRGRTDILREWVVVEATPPKMEQNGKTSKQCNVNADQIWARRWPPVELLRIRRTGEGQDLKNQRQNQMRVNRGLTPHNRSSGKRRFHWKNRLQVATINVEQDKERGR